MHSPHGPAPITATRLFAIFDIDVELRQKFRQEIKGNLSKMTLEVTFFVFFLFELITKEHLRFGRLIAEYKTLCKKLLVYQVQHTRR